MLGLSPSLPPKHMFPMTAQWIAPFKRSRVPWALTSWLESTNWARGLWRPPIRKPGLYSQSISYINPPLFPSSGFLSPCYLTPKGCPAWRSPEFLQQAPPGPQGPACRQVTTSTFSWEQSQPATDSATNPPDPEHPPSARRTCKGSLVNFGYFHLFQNVINTWDGRHPRSDWLAAFTHTSPYVTFILNVLKPTTQASTQKD